MGKWSMTVAVVVMTTLMGMAVSTAQEGPHEEGLSEQEALFHIADDLQELWVEEPERFQALEEARRGVMELDAMSRSRSVNAARLLSSLDHDMLLPMLWALVNDDPLSSGMGLETWRQWQVGLVEAVGRLRDERSAPVLMSLLEDGPHFPRLVRVTTASIGRSGDVASLERVMELARADESLRSPIVEGLGSSRQEEALDYLLAINGDDGQSKFHRQAARSLGDWLNQGGWETSVYEDRRGMWRERRQGAMEAMVARYVEAPSEVQRELSKSLQLGGVEVAKEVVEGRLAEGDEAQRQALEALLAELEASPLR